MIEDENNCSWSWAAMFLFHGSRTVCKFATHAKASTLKYVRNVYVDKTYCTRVYKDVYRYILMSAYTCCVHILWEYNTIHLCPLFVWPNSHPDWLLQSFWPCEQLIVTPAAGNEVNESQNGGRLGRKGDRLQLLLRRYSSEPKLQPNTKTKLALRARLKSD